MIAGPVGAGGSPQADIVTTKMNRRARILRMSVLSRIGRYAADERLLPRKVHLKPLHRALVFALVDLVERYLDRLGKMVTAVGCEEASVRAARVSIYYRYLELSSRHVI